MTLDELQSKTIDFLRFPLAVGIVWIHTVQPVEADMIQQIDFSTITGNTVYAILSIVFVKLVFDAAVPLFFIISGYLYFRNIKQWGRDEYVKKTRSRIRTLVVPYLLWNAIALTAALLLALYTYYSKGETIPLLSQMSSVEGWLKPFWCQWEYGPVKNTLDNDFYLFFPYIGALWFLRDLIVISLLSPVIYIFVRYTRGWVLLLLAFALYTNIWLHIPGFGIEVFFYFSLGAYFGIYKKNMLAFTSKIQILAALLCLISLFFASYGTPRSFPFQIPIRLSILIFVITACITFFNLSAYLVGKKGMRISDVFTRATFFIFVSHGFAISVLNGLLIRTFSSDNILVKTIQFVVCPLIIVLVCLLTYYLFRKLMPKLLSVLIGSR